MFIKRDFHVLQTPADDGAAGAGAAGEGAGAAAAGSGAGAGAGNALAAGAAAGGVAAGGGAAAGGAAGADEPGIPEKFLVKGADGQADFQATALKLAREGYLPLEKRLGSGDAPPKAAVDYKVTVPEALKDKLDAEALSNDAGLKEFLGRVHAAGLNQKQVDVVLGEFFDRSLKLQSAMPELAAADCEAELRGQDGWKSDTEYSQQVSAAFNAGKQIFGKDFDGVVKDYGNDPRLIRGLASIAKEMGEDTQASPEAQAQIQDSLDALMSSRAYLNANDPQHEQTVAKVTALTARVAGTKSVASGRTHSFKTG